MNKKLLLPCLFAIIIDALGFGLVYPVMTALFTNPNSGIVASQTSIHLRHFYLGIGFMLYPLAMFFGASFMGDLSDSIGRKRVLTVCMLGIGISFFLMALGSWLGSLSLLFIGRALSGLMAGSQPIAQASIADLTEGSEKAKYMSYISVSYCFGAILGPLIGGITSDTSLVSWFGFSTPFFLSSILAIIAFIWVHFSFTHISPVHKKPFHPLRPFTIFIEAFENHSIRKLSMIFLLMQIGFSLYFQFIVVHMRLSFHYTNWQLGAINGMLGLGFAIALFIATPLALKYTSVFHIAKYTLLLTGLAQVLSAIVFAEVFQWIMAPIIAGFDMMAFSALLTLFSDAADKHLQGWVMGIANSIMAVAWALTGFASNLIAFLGTEGIIFWGGILLMLASSLFYFRQGSSFQESH